MDKVNFRRVYMYLFQDIIKNFKIVLSNIIYTICGGIAPVLSIYILKITLKFMIYQNITLNMFIIRVIIFSIILALLEIIADQLENRTYSFFNLLRMNKVTETIEFFNHIDYKYFEDSEFMDKKTKVFRAVSSNGIGVEGIYHKCYELGRKLISIMIIMIIITIDINFYPIIFIVLSSFLSLQLNNKLISQRYNLSTKINSIKRKLDIHNSEASNFKYGKDMRIYSGLKKFKDYMNPYLTYYSNLLNELFKKEFKYSILNVLNNVICFSILSWIIIVKVHSTSEIIFFMYYYLLIMTFISIINEMVSDISFINEESRYVEELITLLEDNKFLLLKKGYKDDKVNLNGNIKITFEDVSFKYPNSDEFVLKKLNFTLYQNEKLAIVGINGCGKTTLIKLLCGLYKPTSGRILINDVEYSNYTYNQVNKIITIAFQDSELMAFTIREYIASSLNDINNELVTQKLIETGLFDKISGFDENIFSMLTKIIDDNGIILSGGESKKLMIARALYKQNAKIVIFDEPTSSLDAVSEKKLYKEFAKWTKNKSVIFISHRLASTKFCDKIILLNQGEIAACGNHSNLLLTCKLYKDMYDMQRKYYVGGEEY